MKTREEKINDFFDILSSGRQFWEEVRKKLLRIVLIFVSVFTVSFFFSGRIIKIFLSLFNLKEVQIITTSPFQFFDLAINTALFNAIVVSFPFAVWIVFSFFKPALTRKESQAFGKIFFSCFFLFCAGSAFGFFIMYYVLIILARFNLNLGVASMWDISLFFSQIMLTSALMGILFQFPVILTILIRLGVLDVQALKKNRRWALSASFIIPALLPPTDGLSLIMMAFPIIILFEITILLNKKSRRRRISSQ